MDDPYIKEGCEDKLASFNPFNQLDFEDMDDEQQELYEDRYVSGEARRAPTGELEKAFARMRAAFGENAFLTTPLRTPPHRNI